MQQSLGGHAQKVVMLVVSAVIEARGVGLCHQQVEVCERCTFLCSGVFEGGCLIMYWLVETYFYKDDLDH